VLAFHLDEHVDHAIARGLQSRGIDCTTTTDAGLLGATDEAHIEFGLRERRVVVTSDPDFLALANEHVPHAGIAFFARGARSIGQAICFLCLMSDCLEPDDMAGKVEFISA
jgi:hypothetical protein